jgi:hypothetical protein
MIVIDGSLENRLELFLAEFGIIFEEILEAILDAAFVAVFNADETEFTTFPTKPLFFLFKFVLKKEFPGAGERNALLIFYLLLSFF